MDNASYPKDMLIDDQLRDVLQNAGTVREHESLARHTTIRHGGPARWYVEVTGTTALVELLSTLTKEAIPWAILGGGSNLVACDEGYRGVIVHPLFCSVEIAASGLVTAEAGAITALFSRKITEAGYVGWEWGVGLPGTVGGAVVGNAGCFGGETCDRLLWVDAWSSSALEVKRYNASECGFGYRESRFKQKGWVVLRAAWQLERTQDQQASRERLQQILQQRKTHQPLGAASAGCLFKNVEANPEQIERVEKVFGPVPTSSRERSIIPAGWLIEKVGLKGHACGGLRVSEQHANFIIQSAHGTARDMRVLQEEIRAIVVEKTGIRLESEVRFLDTGESWYDRAI